MWRVVKLRITSIHTGQPDTLHDNKQVLLSTTSSPHHHTDHLALSGQKLLECFRRNVVGVAKRSKSGAALSFEMCGCFPRVSSDSLTKDCWRKSCIVQWLANGTLHIFLISLYSYSIRQSFIPIIKSIYIPIDQISFKSHWNSSSLRSEAHTDLFSKMSRVDQSFIGYFRRMCAGYRVAYA